MSQTADIIVVGAGIQGASLAFHLARRGANVLVLERATVAAGATGVSSGFVRMHYDLASESRLAWASFPYFRDWTGMVGEGNCGFVRTGFVHIEPAEFGDSLRANVETQRRIGIDTRLVGPAELAAIAPGIVTDDVGVAAYEPESGYADPNGATAGFLAAARRHGTRLIQGCRVEAIAVDGARVTGVTTDRGRFDAPVVVDVAGAWAAELAATAGVNVPVQAWRHATSYFGLPDGRAPDFPIVMDRIGSVYFRPEGRELMLVGLETSNEVGGSPDRPLPGVPQSSINEMIERVCGRMPWMDGGTFRTAHGGQDGVTPDQRAILGGVGSVGPDGLYLACGFSGTGFKTAPAIGASMAELILDGCTTTTVDISDYSLARFAEGRQLVGEHSYGVLWR
jgi:sarcosine oxidase, subunit beta